MTRLAFAQRCAVRELAVVIVLVAISAGLELDLVIGSAAGRDMTLAALHRRMLAQQWVGRRIMFEHRELQLFEAIDRVA
jgi:hypothetical protein